MSADVHHLTPPTTSATLALEAEQAVLGCVMYEPEESADALERLRPDHFSEPLHAEMWLAIQARIRDDLPPDPASIYRALAEHPAMGQIGGLAYVAELVEQAFLPSLASHVEAVIDAAGRREIHRLGRLAMDMAGSVRFGTADQILGEVERAAAEIATRSSTRSNMQRIGATAEENLDAALRGEFAGVKVDLECLDHVTGGIKQDDVWIGGGRSSMGKSIWGLNIIKGIARQGRGVAMLSLEMPTREVQARLIADLAYDPERRYDHFGESNVEYGALLKGRLSASQEERARIAARHLKNLPISVNDRGGLTIDEIRIQAQRELRSLEKLGFPRGAVLIDHIGLVRAHTSRNDSKAAETADIVNELKGIAKQLGAPVIALAQVSRATESRTDKRPTMADLNWSGSIEQIADMVCLLYREAYYLDRSGNDDDKDRAVAVAYDLEMIIAKNRSGPICNLKAFIDPGSNAVRSNSRRSAA